MADNIYRWRRVGFFIRFRGVSVPYNGTRMRFRSLKRRLIRC